MRLAGILVLCVCVLLGGCQVSTSERRVMSDQRPQTRKAKWDGDYRLYRVEAEAKRELVSSYRLLKGQVFGFRADGTRRAAVAGTNEVPLGSGRFEWHLVADEGQFDPILTVAVVGITAAVLTAIGFAAFNAGFELD